MLLICCVHGGVGIRSTVAQESRQPTANDRSNRQIDSDQSNVTAQLIRLDQLADPPKKIAELTRRGQVKLITGGRPNSRPERLPGGGRMAGETQFTLRYRYDSHASWKIIPSESTNSSRNSNVQIRVHFRSMKLFTTHNIWLRNPPSADRFWDDRIVRHEFDHVRISSDPRIETLFRDTAKKIERMIVPLSKVIGTNGKIENTKVQSLIESRMKQTLKQVTDYVDIRYRELDRLTQHGLRPLPDFPRP